MIEVINQQWKGRFLSKWLSKEYLLVCDVCGKKALFKPDHELSSIHSWMFGDFKEVIYGKWNLRVLHFCMDHKDVEIQATVESLI